MSRFDYVRYDERAAEIQAEAKNRCEGLERFTEHNLTSPRAKALVLTNLEQVYMWIGKAIRDDQIARNGTAELQEGRNDE